MAADGKPSQRRLQRWRTAAACVVIGIVLSLAGLLPAILREHRQLATVKATHHTPDGHWLWQRQSRLGATLIVVWPDDRLDVDYGSDSPFAPTSTDQRDLPGWMLGITPNLERVREGVIPPLVIEGVYGLPFPCAAFQQVQHAGRTTWTDAVYLGDDAASMVSVPARLIPLRILWSALLANIAVFTVAAFLVHRTTRLLIGATRTRRGRCRRCGYDLRGLAAGRCPECGDEAQHA